jgi:ELWxxDGT repeat protein
MYPTNVNGTLFFSNFESTHGQELWESNGTTAGTFMVKDINPGKSGSFPKALTNVKGTLFFHADDGTHGSELWKSDGTDAGTSLVDDINPGKSGSSFSFSPDANVNGTLFFLASDGTHGEELWTSNGTTAGTFLVADINPGPTGSYPALLTNVNGALFFSANDGTHGVEPWALAASKASSTTKISSAANPSVFGQPVTFTAVIKPTAPGAGTPTGSVLFKEGATTLGAASLQLVAGVDRAIFTTTKLAVGRHTITATYNGDNNFSGSAATDSASPQVVNKDGTSTVLKSSLNPSVKGHTVTFTATVRASAPGAGIPSGSVTFKDGSQVLGTGTVNSAAQATFTTASLTVGNHIITASYGGNINFVASTSGNLVQVVHAMSTDVAPPDAVTSAMATTRLDRAGGLALASSALIPKAAPQIVATPGLVIPAVVDAYFASPPPRDHLTPIRARARQRINEPLTDFDL